MYMCATNLSSAQVGQMLLHRSLQLGGDLQHVLMVVHHEVYEFGGQQLIQVHFIR